MIKPVIIDLGMVGDMCRKLGVVISGDHIVYTKKPDGWFHGGGYFAKDAAFSHPVILTAVAHEIATRFQGENIQAVIGPTSGAVALAAQVATTLYHQFGVEVRWGYAEVGDDCRILKRGFPEFVKGARTLVVEDVFTSGGSAQQTIQAVQSAGGEVVGVAVICNRGGITAEYLGVSRLESLFVIPMEMFPEEDCPLCAIGQPINMQVGHGAAFYERHPDSTVPRGE